MLGCYWILFWTNAFRVNILEDRPFLFEHTATVQLFSPVSGPKTNLSGEHSDMANRKKMDKCHQSRKLWAMGPAEEDSIDITLFISAYFIFSTLRPCPSDSFTYPSFSFLLSPFPIFFLLFPHANLSSVIFILSCFYSDLLVLVSCFLFCICSLYKY